MHTLKFTLTLFIFILIHFAATGQSKISITIDDVPNTRLFEQDNYESKLLKKLDSLNIPIAIFINEGLIYRTDAFSKNFELLNQWAQRKYITLGTHTYSHPYYSKIGFEDFSHDIIKGEIITKELGKHYQKEVKYFRAPYNDLGKDSIEQFKLDSFLNKNGYISTPFTVESSDWMYNAVYRYHLKTMVHASF